MASELMQPWKIAWNIYSPLVRQLVQGMKVVRDDYVCGACNRGSFICPRCRKASKLYGKPKQANVIKCSECGKDSVFRLD